MKKAFLLPMALTVLLAGFAQAVTVHWAVTTFPSGIGGVEWVNITDAVLVYTTALEGIPVFSGASFETGSFTAGTQVGDVVSGMAITPEGIGEIATFDMDTRTEGAYYIVLFGSVSGQASYTYSTVGLAYDDPDKITTDPMTPATQVYDPVGETAFAGWTPVPEPSSAGLLFAGIATALLRRRRRTA